MRIGIDMLALQSPGSRSRGVGRFGRNLVERMLTQGEGHEFVLYAHEGYPTDLIPDSSRAVRAAIDLDPSLGERRSRDAVERIARTNPHGLDALVNLNPFEQCPFYDPPTRRPGRDGLVLAAVVHDLIPFLFQEQYLGDPRHAAWNYRRLRSLKYYDVILTNSDATRADCLRMLDLSADRVVTIGGAGNAAFFTPDRSFPPSRAARRVLNSLGIRRPFVYCVSGIDERKNLRGLFQAYSLLPEPIRREHQLVVTCSIPEHHASGYRDLAAELGIFGDLVLTGEIADDSLRILYQRCSAFAFPSKYEGLGLPLLEAMLCGAAVVAGRNSSQVEVVGDAGLLANAEDAADVAAKLATILADPAYARSLGQQAIAQARAFRWEDSADRALAAVDRAVERAGRPPRLRAPRPRLAIVAPWPPKSSGIADYSIRLADALRDRYTIEMIHEDGYVPARALGSADFGSYDHRAYARRAAVLGYRGVLYQMGNSYYHKFLYEMLLRHPGIVTLHDFNLAGFHFWRAHQDSEHPLDTFRLELAHSHPEHEDDPSASVEDWMREPGGVQGACVRRRLFLNRRVLEAAQAVIVHSPWCRERVQQRYPELVSKVHVVPMGATPRHLSPERRAATRARFGLPTDALILGSFGHLTRDKLNVEAIRAYAALAGELAGDARMIFVGKDWESGLARSEAFRLGVEQRIRFLGPQGDDDFADLIAAVDLGIALRRPPTFGETSAALLDLLRHGVPTIVTDVATFSCYPDDIVRKVRWENDQAGLDNLVQALRELVAEPSRRESLGAAAHRHVIEEHAWARAADLYADVIEAAHGDRRASLPA